MDGKLNQNQQALRKVRPKKEFEKQNHGASIVHDIDSYQTELAMQCDELKKTQEELLQAKDRLEKLHNHFSLLYHHAPHGYVTLDKNGIVIQANETFAKKINVNLQLIEGRPFVTWLLPAEQKEFRLRFRALFAEPRDKVIELALKSRNNEPFHVALRARKIESDYVAAKFITNEHVLLVSVNDITAQKVREEEIRRLAYYDAVTNLPNRRFFLEKLGDAMRYCKRHRGFFAVIFLDLDGFKAVNDTLGHQSGDLLLREVGKRLKANVRDGDAVARQAGDEFVLLLSDVGLSQRESVGNAERIAEKIINHISEPYYIKGRVISISASIGVTLFPMESGDEEEILKQADHAMYDAKKAGKGQVRFFHKQMQEEANEKARIEAGIRHGIGDRQFFLMYQPKVDQNGIMRSVEALARWHREEEGVIQPDKFIAVAEQSDAIYDIWLITLDIAARQSQKWQHQISISINVSPRTFHNHSFLADVKSIFSRYAVPAGVFVFELTENVFVSDLERVTETMNELVELGFSFSLDDFGTGYSSLLYLQKLPIRELKLDRQFISLIGSSAANDVIVDAVLGLGRSLGIEVVAEGIEEKSQLDYLLRKGCQYFQGYYFDRPLTAEEIERKY